METRAKTSSVGAFLTELFSEFERQGVEYAVARDYGPLPASLADRDLDVLIGKGQLENAYQVVKSVAHMLSATVLRIDQESVLWLLVVHLDRPWVLRVDLALPDSHTWRGVSFLKLDRALQNKVQEGGIFRLRARDIVCMQLSRDIMGSFKLRRKYRSAVQSIYQENPYRFKAELNAMFGRRCGSALAEVCREGTFEHLKHLGKQMRRAVIVKGLMRKPLKTTSDILRYVGWRCGEYVRPNGVTVALIGPDGSGKGTLIEAVRRFADAKFHFPTRVYHCRPGLLPSLGSLLLGRKDDEISVSDPHDRAPSGMVASCFRLAYYTLDYLLGYWLIVRPHLGRKCILTIFDRYFYDYFIDPVRFRISLPQFAVKMFGMMVPNPDVVIFLSADPELIYKRKQELTLSEIQRQLSEMSTFSKYVENYARIDSSGRIEDTARDMIQVIVAALAKRLH